MWMFVKRKRTREGKKDARGAGEMTHRGEEARKEREDVGENTERNPRRQNSRRDRGVRSEETHGASCLRMDSR